MIAVGFNIIDSITTLYCIMHVRSHPPTTPTDGMPPTMQFFTVTSKDHKIIIFEGNGQFLISNSEILVSTALINKLLVVYVYRNDKIQKLANKS